MRDDLDGELRRLLAELRRVLAAIWRESRGQAWLWWDSRVLHGGRRLRNRWRARHR
jgi:hypothetical protein